MIKKMYKYILEFIKEKYEIIKKRKRVLRIKDYSLYFILNKEKIYNNFLFDSLNFIAKLCRIDSIKSHELLVNINTYLKSIMNNNEGIIKLNEEISLLKIYFSIASIIYSNDINLYINLPSDIINMYIPFLIFQPLVENSIKHGISPKLIGGDIYINAQENEDFVEFIIKDTGVGMTREEYEKVLKMESGFGLKITRERLKRLYGENTYFKIESSIEEGTIVYFKIPKEVYDV
ncbi:sensor histidine kinase [Caloramator sp. E03]|uniref:sensor histidine kinase n=1 Tax=Caloramator sp. E03 TaxID=2576307 RepID=UPI00143DB4F6|nr:ATP-binding protein [Caloramator sp. E03]